MLASPRRRPRRAVAQAGRGTRIGLGDGHARPAGGRGGGRGLGVPVLDGAGGSGGAGVGGVHVGWGGTAWNDRTKHMEAQGRSEVADGRGAGERRDMGHAI